MYTLCNLTSLPAVMCPASGCLERWEVTEVCTCGLSYGGSEV
jgi:hypothetical protein